MFRFVVGTKFSIQDQDLARNHAYEELHAIDHVFMISSLEKFRLSFVNLYIIGSSIVRERYLNSSNPSALSVSPISRHICCAQQELPA